MAVQLNWLFCCRKTLYKIVWWICLHQIDVNPVRRREESRICRMCDNKTNLLSRLLVKWHYCFYRFIEKRTRRKHSRLSTSWTDFLKQKSREQKGDRRSPISLFISLIFRPIAHLLLWHFNGHLKHDSCKEMSEKSPLVTANIIKTTLKLLSHKMCHVNGFSF